MPFWKSAPYLAHFMHNYKFNERLDEALRTPEKLFEALRRHDPAFLKAADLRSWSRFDPRTRQAPRAGCPGELLDEGLWRLLWLPPTLPYWPLEGPFQGKELTTKRLLFSAWNVVPDVVSAILSYEAERRMVGGRLDDYENPAGQQRPLLRLTQAASGERSRHRQEVVDAGAQLRPLGLGDVEMAPEIEQGALPDGVADALAMDEPMGEVGLSVVCAPCLCASNEHDVHDSGRPCRSQPILKNYGTTSRFLRPRPFRINNLQT